MNENMEPNVTQTPAPAPKKASPLVWIIAIIVLAAALVGGWYAGRQFANNEDDDERTSEKSDKKSKKDKDKDEDEDEDEDEKETKKDTKKPSSGTKQIVCSGDYEGMATISVSFDYSNSKQTITDGGMDMKIDYKALAESMGVEITEAQLKDAMADADLCEEFGDDDRYKNCKASLNGMTMDVHLDFDVDEMLAELTDAEKQEDAEKLAADIEKGLNADSFAVKCSVK